MPFFWMKEYIKMVFNWSIISNGTLRNRQVVYGQGDDRAKTLMFFLIPTTSHPSLVAGEHTVYRYNESLTLAWLSGRVDSVRQMLKNLTDPELIDQVRFSYSRTSSVTSDTECGTPDACAPAFASSEFCLASIPLKSLSS